MSRMGDTKYTMKRSYCKRGSSRQQAQEQEEDEKLRKAIARICKTAGRQRHCDMVTL